MVRSLAGARAPNLPGEGEGAEAAAEDDLHGGARQRNQAGRSGATGPFWRVARRNP